MAQQYETAQFMPAAVRPQLGAQLVCYSRSVIHQEWPALESGTEAEGFNPWGIEMFRTLKAADPRTTSEQAAYDKWLDRTRTASKPARTGSTVPSA